MRSILKILKVAHGNLLGIAKMLIGRYGGHIENFGFWELDAQVELILSIDEG
jgi:hypothetical protein